MNGTKTNAEIANDLMLATIRGEASFRASVVAALDAKDAAVKVPLGHIMDDTGTVRKVLGTLPLTVDGCLIGDGAWCWKMVQGVEGPDDAKPARISFRACPVTDPDAYTGVRRVWSSRESVLAHKEAKR
jgi:hypothetical protein